MGILNITPDSFADGGVNYAFVDALKRAKVMIAEGVDIIDVGGESTRPGADRITMEEERDRVIPIISELKELKIPISIDTTRAAIAQAAISAGANYVNDVSGGLADPDMATLISGLPEIQYIVMHWRGHSKVMSTLANYSDVVAEVRNELEDRVRALMKVGVNADQIILDPGLGFAKNASHNWEILRNLDRFSILGFPILIGASRKRFLSELVAGELSTSDIPADRENASIAVTANLVRTGIWGVRTHSVKPHQEAISVAMEMMK
jgi:dihydropteroate synthase